MLKRRIEKESFIQSEEEKEGERKVIRCKGSAAKIYVDGLRSTEGALLCATRCTKYLDTKTARQNQPGHFRKQLLQHEYI